MRLVEYWRQLVCLLRGHQWMTYWHPHGDDWFGGPHWRQECDRCDADRARIEAG